MFSSYDVEVLMEYDLAARLVIRFAGGRPQSKVERLVNHANLAKFAVVNLVTLIAAQVL
jgi:hypothetical protein